MVAGRTRRTCKQFAKLKSGAEFWFRHRFARLLKLLHKYCQPNAAYVRQIIRQSASCQVGGNSARVCCIIKELKLKLKLLIWIESIVAHITQENVSDMLAYF